MRVAEVKSKTVKTYTVTVEDGEVRDQPYSRSGRRYRVSRVTVEKRDGNVSIVELSGYAMKKDGTEGLTSATERLYGGTNWPDWLKSVIGGLA